MGRGPIAESAILGKAKLILCKINNLTHLDWALGPSQEKIETFMKKLQ